MEPERAVRRRAASQIVSPPNWTHPLFALTISISFGLLAVLANYGLPILMMSQIPTILFVLLIVGAVIGVSCFSFGIAQWLWSLRQNLYQHWRRPAWQIALPTFLNGFFEIQWVPSKTSETMPILVEPIPTGVPARVSREDVAEQILLRRR